MQQFGSYLLGNLWCSGKLYKCEVTISFSKYTWIFKHTNWLCTYDPALSTRGNLARARARGAGPPRTVKYYYLPGLGRDKNLMMRDME